ncbi:hypothetical protein F5B20DRAFT_584719 [Whalleya microplaca]|nr:hypothetical protein F5B20DRAFT_584719 [Whalleya microplaca]
MANNASRPTPHTLPKLVIPQSNNPTPEEITISRTEDFLRFYTENKYAPVHTLPLPNPKPEEEQGEDAQKIQNKSPVMSATLMFTTREWEELDAKKVAYEEMKTQHTYWYEEMKRKPKDPEVIRQCRYFRQLRENLDMEMSALQDRRRIRREARQDLNKDPELDGRW